MSAAPAADANPRQIHEDGIARLRKSAPTVAANPLRRYGQGECIWSCDHGNMTAMVDSPMSQIGRSAVKPFRHASSTLHTDCGPCIQAKEKPSR
ncbi:hypothetical protein CQ393_09080 [Stenotrophomonas sp. MYb238]|uniref:hypothetical protein n=1 Tax=Stenotrophomonas sp. MYb238 TaxID=2040281 RepID=UPI0012920C9C|nr:hypothetical protein [Stenotrophomonas sp. MYb238]MQP76044.1 hypothetical protein [Stenotrophomonas sp. MYb238]